MNEVRKESKKEGKLKKYNLNSNLRILNSIPLENNPRQEGKGKGK